MSGYIDINPEEGEPQGSYFGLIVTDGYDWHQCYSYAWEQRTYFNGHGVHQSFPDMDEEDLPGIMHQVLAIDRGLAEMPEKRFFKRSVIEDLAAAGQEGE